jgi:hypothetical protein
LVPWKKKVYVKNRVQVEKQITSTPRENQGMTLKVEKKQNVRIPRYTCTCRQRHGDTGSYSTMTVSVTI